MTDNVAVFLPSLRAGGAERAMVNLSRGLVEKGLPVSLVLARAEGLYSANLSEGIQIIDLEASRTLSSTVPLRKYLRDERPAVLISAMDHANIVAILAAKWARVGTNVLVTVHRMVSEPTHLRSLGRREAAIPYLASRVYRWANCVIAVSRAAAEDLSNRYRLPLGDIQVIPNPVVSQDLFRLARKEVQNDWISAEIPLILGVGRLTPEKDFATLIRAFARVESKRPSRLIILGDGPERTNLETLVSELGLEEIVALRGIVENPYAFMARASVFVLPSIWESFGIVLVEALACGTPVVATKSKGGVEEILEGNRYGQMVPVGDDETMAESILETLENPPAAEMLRRRANDFTVERVVDQYIQLF